MKNLTVIIVLGTLTPIAATAQTSKPCCKMSATTEFAMLGKADQFKSTHLSPAPLVFTPESGKMIKIHTPDGKEASAFVVMSKEKSDKYLLVFHEWWGLNDHIKKESERLAYELGNVNVIAPDLYDGKVATNSDEASRLMQSLNEERAKSIVTGTINHAGSGSQIQTIGWCMGGGWSLQTAIMASAQGRGCVMYYGMPENDKVRLKKLNGPVLGIFATKDEWINNDVVTGFEENMNEIGKSVTVKWYEADHAFANPSNPQFEKEAADDAHQLAVGFLQKNWK